MALCPAHYKNPLSPILSKQYSIFMCVTYSYEKYCQPYQTLKQFWESERL